MTSAGPNSHSLPERPALRARWTDRLASVLFALLCFEVGLFLLIYPWMDSWNWNLLVTAFPQWTAVLRSEQFRGAVSGLGVLNLLIGFWEALRLRKFSG